MAAGFEGERLSMLGIEQQVQALGAGFLETVDVDANVAETYHRTNGQAAPVPVVASIRADCVLPSAGGADGRAIHLAVRGGHDAAGEQDMPTRVVIELAVAGQEVQVAIADVHTATQHTGEIPAFQPRFGRSEIALC